VSGTLVGLAIRYYFLPEGCCLKFAVLILWGSLSDERTGSAIYSAIIHWSESRTTRNHTLLSLLRLPEPGGPGSLIYIPQEQGGPVKPLGIGFPLRRLLGLAGLRCMHSNPLPTWKARSPYIHQEWDGPVKSQSHVATDGQSVSQSVCLGV
jgi:hypothetical protein